MPNELTEATRGVADLWRQAAWLPEWAVIALVIAACLAAGYLTHLAVFSLLGLTARRRDAFWQATLKRARTKLRLLMLLIAVMVGVTISPMDAEPSQLVRRVCVFLAVLTVGWLAMGALHVWTTLYSRRFDVSVEDNLAARRHLTQTRILERVGTLLIAVASLGLALLTVPGFGRWGVSLLASAGVVGIIAGLALQPVLTNMLAGVQIALTQPIRIDDAVIVENEWGNVEEITSTYVVVRLWDWRRMVLPLSYFITTPFQNWTRETSRLIGTVFFYVDYEAPIDRLRATFEEIVKSSKLWDGDVQVLQVTEITDRVLQVRCLASARSAPVAFDLRCEIRERMMAFMRDECPEALPRDRIDFERPQGPGEVAGAASPPAQGLAGVGSDVVEKA